MTPEFKKNKDRARLAKEMRKNPKLIVETLETVYGKNGGTPCTFKSAGKFIYLQKLGKFLDVAMISYLVGNGIIQPQKDKQSTLYCLSTKGRNFFPKVTNNETKLPDAQSDKDQNESHSKTQT